MLWKTSKIQRYHLFFLLYVSVISYFSYHKLHYFVRFWTKWIMTPKGSYFNAVVVFLMFFFDVLLDYCGFGGQKLLIQFFKRKISWFNVHHQLCCSSRGGVCRRGNIWWYSCTLWIQAQKFGAIIGLWKKNILNNFDNQNQEKKNFWIRRLFFWGPS